MFEKLNTLTMDALARFGWNGHEPFALPGSLRSRVVIAGLTAAGQRCLLNNLWGWEVLSETGQRVGVQEYGLFAVANLPHQEEDVDAISLQMAEAELVIYVLDGRKGLRPVDFLWVSRLRANGADVLTVLNTGQTGHMVQIDDIGRRLGTTIYPFDLSDHNAMRTVLLPALLDTTPRICRTLASEITDLRRPVATRLIVRSTLICALAYTNATSSAVTTTLDNVRENLVGQIAEIYGKKNGHNQEKDAVVSALIELGRQYASEALTAILPKTGPVGASVVAALLTWMVGMVAQAYYGGEMPPISEWVGNGWEQLQNALPRR